MKLAIPQKNRLITGLIFSLCIVVSEPLYLELANLRFSLGSLIFRSVLSGIFMAILIRGNFIKENK